MNIITCTILVNSIHALVLIDSGASHSFVSSTFSTNIKHKLERLEQNLELEVVGGRMLKVTRVYKDNIIEMENVSSKPISF